MKRFLSLLCLAFLCINSIAAQQIQSTDNLIDPWYFGIEFEPINGETVPGYHSFAYATYGSKWLIVGGRTNGLHGLNSNSNFETEFSNNNIIVIDTTDWQWSTASLQQLPMSMANPLRSTNMQFLQKGDRLYMAGGYGWDSTNAMFATFPTLTSIDIPGMINAVEVGDSISPFIKQFTDSSLAICGGEMEIISDTFYIIGGHKFEGRYNDQPNGQFTQTYTNSIRSFTITDVPNNPLSSIMQAEYTDTNNLHRRDLNVVKLNFNNTEQLVILGGVFQKNANLPYTMPMAFDGHNLRYKNHTQQEFNQYTSAHFSIRQDENNSGIVLLGGMGTRNHLNVYDSLVPFVKTIALERLYIPTANLDISLYEYLLPDTTPGFLGSNAVFIPGNVLPVDTNGSYSLFDLPLMNYEPRIFAGYLFGGIRGTAPNNAISSANDVIYRVYFKGLNSLGIKEVLPTAQIKNLYPNPANDNTVLQLSINKSQQLTVSIFATNGALQQVAYTGKAAIGSQNISLDTAQLAAGLYFVTIQTPEGLMVKKLSVAH